MSGGAPACVGYQKTSTSSVGALSAFFLNLMGVVFRWAVATEAGFGLARVVGREPARGPSSEIHAKKNNEAYWCADQCGV